MKTRFSTLDVVAILPEIRAKCCDGWRLNQVYDCDNKTYIFKLNKTLVQMRSESDQVAEEDVDSNKLFLIIESGQRIHTTDFDWPKSHVPNGFALKLRKHLRNKRVASIEQLGIDRLIDIQFGQGEAAYHLIAELYDRGNLILTDNEYIILNILRHRKSPATQGFVSAKNYHPNAKSKRPQNSKDQKQDKVPGKDKNGADTQGKDSEIINENDSENFRVGQRYPTSQVRREYEKFDHEKIKRMLSDYIELSKKSRGSENTKSKGKIQKLQQSLNGYQICLRDLLTPLVVNYGAAIVESSLSKMFASELNGKKCTISISCEINDGILDNLAHKILAAITDIENKFASVKDRAQNRGFILQKVQLTQLPDESTELRETKNVHNSHKNTKNAKNAVSTSQKEQLTPSSNDKNPPSSDGDLGSAVDTKSVPNSNLQDLQGSQKSVPSGINSKEMITNIDFYPLFECAQYKSNLELANQAKNKPNEKSQKMQIQEFESFDNAVDHYYSSLESQKIDTRALTIEKDAFKRVEHVKHDHQRRLDDLNRAQQEDENKARLIEYNCEVVEKALLIMRSLIANQMSWTDIERTIREAKDKGDPIASLIEDKVKFDRNSFTMRLSNPYSMKGSDLSSNSDSGSECDNSEIKKNKKSKSKNNKCDKITSVDIDIGLSAFANARKYFDKRRFAVQKERKTIDQSKLAFKNVERQVREKLKEVVIKSNITKSRRRYWFEQFFWFLSSDGFLVVAGRDAEQNELLVKRYMKQNDIYVHADLHGASSVIIKNHIKNVPKGPAIEAFGVPPKTLVEAGTMAVCYSSAWDAKIATTSWWVYPNQVTKTAPAGEYLTMGAFVIRGKKNFLPLSTLVLGFGFLFKLEDSSIERRVRERLRRQQMEAVRNESVVEESCKDSTELDKNAIALDNQQFTLIHSSPATAKRGQNRLIAHLKDQTESVDEKNAPKTILKNSERFPNAQKNQSRFYDNLKNQCYKEASVEGQRKTQKELDENQTKSHANNQGQENELKVQMVPIDAESLSDEDDNNDDDDKSLHDESESDNDKDTVSIVTNDKSNKNENEKNNDGDDDNIGDDEDDDDDDQDAQTEHRLIDALTGCPTPEDVLMYAIPVCGPYSALQSYKYKVKVIPGTNKRGKAAKMSLNLFLMDKTSTQREKDLLKSCKDQDYARNVPNKVKVSAVNLSKSFQKKKPKKSEVRLQNY